MYYVSCIEFMHESCNFHIKNLRKYYIKLNQLIIFIYERVTTNNATQIGCQKEQLADNYMIFKPKKKLKAETTDRNYSRSSL